MAPYGLFIGVVFQETREKNIESVLLAKDKEIRAFKVDMFRLQRALESEMQRQSLKTKSKTAELKKQKQVLYM